MKTNGIKAKHVYSEKKQIAVYLKKDDNKWSPINFQLIPIVKLNTGLNLKTNKMKNLLTIALMVLIIFAASSCSTDDDCIFGSGTVTTQTIPLESFSGIQSSGSDSVIISQGDVQEVTVTGHPNIISRLKRNVSNGIWKAELEDGCYENSDLVIHIKVPNMNYVKLAGSANAVINDFINQQNMEIRIEGSASFELNNNQGTENLDISIEGNGYVVGNGSFGNLEYLDIQIFGSGYYNAFSIETNSCSIYTEGSGYCNVFVNDNLDVIINGSTEVNYKGYPTITSNISGSGSINNAN